MEKTKKTKRSALPKSKLSSLPVKREIAQAKVKQAITDQNAGPQQLYEGRKVGVAAKNKSIPTDAKKVRHHAHKKINKLLGIKGSGAVHQKTSTK